MEYLWGAIGRGMSDFIVGLSDVLTGDVAPGLLSIAILLALGAVVILFGFDVWRNLRALNWLDEQILAASDRPAFARRVDGIAASIKEKRESETGYRYVAAAWIEFQDTFVPQGEGEERIFRNSVRPSSFFNLEDLHCGPRFYRYLPGIFVSVGLLLTFFGLVAALHSLEVNLGSAETTDDMRVALERLLGVVSAKFIMSLTGLFSSIFFTLVLRLSIASLERKLHRICASLEERLKFVSLEDLAMEQLAVAKRNEESFREIGMELVERVGEQLRQEMTPLIKGIEGIGTAGVKGVKDMVENLSELFSKQVGTALVHAGDQLKDAGEKVSSTASSVNEGTKETLQLLNQFSSEGTMALQEAVKNIRESADAISQTAKNLAEAATPIHGSVAEIEASVVKLSENTERASEALIHGVTKVAEDTRQVLSDSRDIIGKEREAILATMQGLTETLERSDNLDQKLRDAFDEYTKQVDEAMKSLYDHVGKITHDLAPMIEKMRKIVEDAQKFIPETRG